MSSRRRTKKDFFTTGEVARVLGVAPMTVINYCKRGELAMNQSALTGYRRIPRDAVLAFMKAHSIPEDRIDRIEPFRVLIADDEPGVRWTIRETIKMLIPDATVVEAADGYTACLEAGSMAPHLVTLDLQMPQMSGFEVCASFRAVEKTRSTKILVITSFGTRENVEEVRRLGADDFLSKPFTVPELKAKISEMLGLDVKKQVGS